ncbi:beta-microseminoprotein J1-like [Engraulis encrasicolus]|uniref:beta-microseminoprotein J1-like n=1 Tax=Engraulis encrasicolus TaxID=184585 RepID=UPI002FD65A91
MVPVVLLVMLSMLPSMAQGACTMGGGPKPVLVKVCRGSDNLLHEVGTKWRTKDCKDCTCSSHGMSCCDVGATSITFPDHCVEVYDKKNCRRYAVERDDLSTECKGPVIAVGK